MSARYSKYHIRYTSAFTLIEILVSLTIVGILFSFGYASFRDFSRRQALAGIVKQVQGDLRLAQQMALSGQKPTTLCVQNLDGVSFTVSATGYQVQYDCGTSHPLVKDPVVFPAGISASPLPSPNPIQFKVLGNGTNITSGGSATITLTLAGALNQVVTVTAGGEIK